MLEGGSGLRNTHLQLITLNPKLVPQFKSIMMAFVGDSPAPGPAGGGGEWGLGAGTSASPAPPPTPPSPLSLTPESLRAGQTPWLCAGVSFGPAGSL